MMSAQYEISTDTGRLDVAQIHEFLRSSYWARNIPRSVVEKSLMMPTGYTGGSGSSR